MSYVRAHVHIWARGEFGPLLLRLSTENQMLPQFLHAGIKRVFTVKPKQTEVRLICPNTTN